jgi:hypothetical protein
MQMTRSRLWGGTRILLVVAALAATAMGADTKKKEEKPEQQMLFKIFKPIMRDIGSCNTAKAKVVSGPVEMKMANNKKPGKQWWVSFGPSKFKLTIEDSSALTLTKALAFVERVPTAYLRALEVVSEDKKAGLAFYKTLGGAAAHGGQSYLNMIPLKPARAASVIVHEAGHILEQRARSKEEDILDRWAEAVKADKIDVSNYGNHVNHEDLAEFARIYAFCTDRALGRGKLEALAELSPARFKLWERMLKLSGTKRGPEVARKSIKPNEEWQKRIAKVDANIEAAKKKANRG